LNLRVFSWGSLIEVFVLFLCSLGVSGYLGVWGEKGDYIFSSSKQSKMLMGVVCLGSSNIAGL
jgi:hypothetical protein